MKLGIYGAGGLGRETLNLAQKINAVERRWSEIFFIDDINPDRILKGISVLSFAEIKNNNQVEIIIAVGEPALRTVLMNRVKSCQLPLATLISSAAYIAPCCRIGAGVAIFQGVNISCDSIIEDNVVIQAFSSISHDCRVAESCVISTYCAMAGKVLIGARTFLGMGALIREMTSVGADTIIGMGANVVTTIPDKVVAVGNPARTIKPNSNYKIFR